MSVEDKLINTISEQLGVDKSKVTPEASFTTDLGADSLDSVELIMAIEDEFEIEIPDEDVEKLKTVGELQDYINQNAKS